MRQLTSLTLAVVFAAGLLLTVTATHAQTLGKGIEAKSGLEVAARVQGLRRDNLNLNAALHQFERRGHRPKFEEASSISGTIERADKGARNERGFAIRKANFAQTIRDGSIELIFVPVLETPTEWQGTLIARLYNYYNQVAVEEVFNLVMVQQSTGQWIPVYELSFLDGHPYVHYRSGMYAAFALGVTIANHPAVTGSAPSTYFQSWQINQGGDPYPCPYGTERIDPLLPNCQPSYLKQSRSTPLFKPASYRLTSGLLPQHPGAGGPQERFPGRCLTQGSRCSNFVGTINNVDSWLGLMGGRVRQTAHDSFGMCAAAGLISFGNLTRFAQVCGGQLINQAGRHIFRIW